MITINHKIKKCEVEFRSHGLLQEVVAKNPSDCFSLVSRITLGNNFISGMQISKPRPYVDVTTCKMTLN